MSEDFFTKHCLVMVETLISGIIHKNRTFFFRSIYYSIKAWNIDPHKKVTKPGLSNGRPNGTEL